MHQQLIEPLLEIETGLFTFAADRINGYDYITEQMWGYFRVLTFLHRKGDHIGWAGPVQVLPVEFRYLGVIHNYNGKLSLRTVQGV